MVISLNAVIPLGSKSRTRHPSIYPGVDELNYNDPTRNRGGYNYHNLWVSIKQVVWRQYNPYLSKLWRYSRFRFSVYYNNSWFRLHSRSDIKSSYSSVRNTSNRKRNRHHLYYSFLIGILTVGCTPAYAEDGETNNTSNPVAAATGNVTNQAVQFQNNGAPSRQQYGPNISCNGSTMTFSPFYMGNHTKPWEIDEGTMAPSSYTIAENWGGQINFMIPLDREGLRRCRAIAKQQHEKMKLNYELVRIDNCAKLQQKGFMLVPGSRVYHMCSDVVPIVGFTKLIKEEQNKQCTPIKEFRWPWQKKLQKCPKTFKKINPQQLLNPLSKFQVNNQQKPPEAH